MAQNFLVIVRGTLDDIEQKVNDAFYELAKDNFRIMNTRYYLKDDKTAIAFIQYAPSRDH